MVTACILLICIVVYIIQLAYPGGYVQSMEDWGEVPTRILSGGSIPGTQIPAYWSWLSSMFMHGGFLHLFGNMLMLWIVGDNIEWLFGRLRFTLFYLACGLLANVVTTYLGYESSLPGVGASGAIAGVMAAYLIHYPRARITSLLWIDPLSLMHAATGSWGFTVHNISAYWYIGSWVVLQLLFSGVFVAVQTHANLGIYAHAAGALCGVLLAFALPIASRRPAPEDPAVSGELTDALWGEEGDAGAGREALSVEEELRRLQLEGRASGRPYRASPVQDYIADELLAQGDAAGALRHCEEMRRMALSRGESDRAEGYLTLIESLHASLTPATERGDVGI